MDVECEVVCGMGCGNVCVEMGLELPDEKLTSAKSTWSLWQNSARGHTEAGGIEREEAGISGLEGDFPSTGFRFL